VGKIAKEDQTA